MYTFLFIFIYTFVYRSYEEEMLAIVAAFKYGVTFLCVKTNSSSDDPSLRKVNNP